MNFPFFKMHGLGNDFVIIDQRVEEFTLTTQDITLIADRKLGVGCDQVIIIKKHPKYDCSMEIFNQDGSSAEACGNATRCVALLIPNRFSKISVTDRVLETENNGDGGVTVNMGRPEFAWNKIPITKEQNNPIVYFTVPGFEIGVVVNIGNPHLIFFVNELDNLDVTAFGRRFENDALFPNRVNVSFARIMASNLIKLRVWERGVGETKACGTAACATFAGARKLMLVDNAVTIRLPGGILTCTEEKDGSIKMHGPAKLEFEEVWRG